MHVIKHCVHLQQCYFCNWRKKERERIAQWVQSSQATKSIERHNSDFYWLHTCNRIFSSKCKHKKTDAYTHSLTWHHLSFPFIYYLLKCSNVSLRFFMVWFRLCSFKQMAIYSHWWVMHSLPFFVYRSHITAVWISVIFAVRIPDCDYVLHGQLFHSKSRSSSLRILLLFSSACANKMGSLCCKSHSLLPCQLDSTRLNSNQFNSKMEIIVYSRTKLYSCTIVSLCHYYFMSNLSRTKFYSIKNS